MELVEREANLQDLVTHLHQAATGQGRVVFIGGEAGIGKTALVSAFCRRIGPDVAVLRASCDALSTPGPLGLLRDLGPALGIQPDGFASDREGRDQLFRAVLDALATADRTTVLVAEDAHWADGATIDLLRFLARRIGAHPLLAVVTYRDDELAPDHPLRLLLGDLATAATIHRLRVCPLSDMAVRQLASGSNHDAAALHRLTGGNPFFLTEVLAANSASVPATVGDAVLARAARLSPEARAVLDVAAVIGSAIDADLLQCVAGAVFDETDECIMRGLIQGDGDGLAFRHELAREAILGAIPPTRCRLLHARVLAALLGMPETERDPALLAHHAEAAGNREAVLEFAVAAAVQAETSHAHREAASQYARALRFSDRLPAAERAHLYEGRSRACHLSDLRTEAIEARQSALGIWRTLDDILREGESLRWLSRHYWFDGRGMEAEEAATAALDLLESLPPGPELAMAYSNLAQLRMLDDDLAETLRWGEKAIALAEELELTETLVHALANVGSARLYAGDDHGYDELTRSLHLALGEGLVDHAGRALTNLAWTTLLAMRLDEADRQITAALAYAIEHDLDTYRWYLLAGRAALRVPQGGWDIADGEIRQLLQQPIISSVTRIVALTALGQLQARRGNSEADAVLDEALALAERNGQLSRVGPVRAARVEAALLNGDVGRARVEAAAVREQIFIHGHRWLQGEFAWLLWQAGERGIPTEDLAEPYARQIAGDFAGAAAAWRALGCPYEEARALAESEDPALVRCAIATFDRLGAQPALGHAMRRLRQLGVRDLPPVRRGPRASTRANPAGLTQREAEVLMLLVKGLHNAEIAERLFLSPKTVRHHIAVILTKLGVETRAEAARAAAKLGLIPA